MLQDTNRIPAAALSVSELVEALVTKPGFRGVVIWDANQPLETVAADTVCDFRWRSMGCDARTLCGNILEALPLTAAPSGSHEGNGQSA